ncbi:MAG TPA: hypothetical protein GXX51_05775 [Firmicutes bacterium]|nr:hypothetical protein [Bacillota bacterium]
MATRDEIKQTMVDRVIAEGLVGPDGQPMPAMDSVLDAVADGIILGGASPHAGSHITGGSDLIPNAVPNGASGLMSGMDKAKLDGIEPGAQVNQNAFSYVKVGATTIEADSKTDTLELAAGSNIALTPDAANDKVTIALTGTVPSAQNADTVDNKHASDFALLGHGHTGGTDGNQIGTSGLQDGAVTDAKVGNRTVDQAQAPTGNTGALTQLFSWIVNRIKAITGATNWFDNPVASLASIWAKFNASTGHKHTGAADDGPQIDYASITGKPNSFVPSAHKSTHASGGSDALTPGDIGAVNKSGDTISGNLTLNALTKLKTVRQGCRDSESYYPNVVSDAQNTTVNGAWIIHTPIPRAANIMFTIHVHGYAYGIGAVVDFTISGYAYSGSNGSVDGQPGAVISYELSDNGTDGWNKYIGIDANGKVAVAFGDYNDSAYYFRISVDAWITNTTTDYSTGWSIDRSTVQGFGWLDIKGPLTSQHPAMDFLGSIKVSGNTVWHAGNDGAGSGMDADLVRGRNLAGEFDTHKSSRQDHGVGSSYIAKTSRSDQLPSWNDIPDKPTSFTPSTHKSTHASGGSDALTPGDIGAIPSSEKGQPNGVATLDSGGRVPESQLPSTAGMVVHGNEWHDPDFVSKAGDTMTGILEIQVPGGPVLRLKSVDSASDHLYIEFYADAHNPNSRSAWFGFGSVGTNVLSLQNQMGGPINLIPGSGQPLQVSGNTVWHAGNAKSLRWFQPGDTILLEALTERSVYSKSYVTVKRFRVMGRGRYRVTGELKTSGPTAYMAVGTSGNISNTGGSSGFSTTSTTYVAFTIDTPVEALPGEEIYVSIYACNTGAATPGTAYIRNVRLRYAEMAEPTDAVLQN